MCGTTFPLPAGMLLPDPCYPSCSSFRHLPIGRIPQRATSSPSTPCRIQPILPKYGAPPEIGTYHSVAATVWYRIPLIIFWFLENAIAVLMSRESSFLLTAPDPRGVPFLGKGPGTDKAPAGVNSNQRGRSARLDPSTCLFPGAGIWCYCTYAWITWAATVPREEPDPPCSTTTARAISGSS